MDLGLGHPVLPLLVELTVLKLEPELAPEQIVLRILKQIVNLVTLETALPLAPLLADLGHPVLPLLVELTVLKPEFVLEQIAQPIQTVKLVMLETVLPLAPLPVLLGAPAQFLAEEELNLELAPEQTVQLILNLKLATLKLVVFLVVLVLLPLA
jgi:hypothetical protein